MGTSLGSVVFSLVDYFDSRHVSIVFGCINLLSMRR